MAAKHKLVVRGNSILRPPLFETDEAHLIEFRGEDNELCALLVKVMSEDTWGLVTKLDADWTATLVRYGYLDLHRPVMDIITTGF